MKVRHTFPSYRCGLPYDDPQNSKVKERIFSISGFTNESSHAGSADWEESSNLYNVLCYNLDTILSDKYFRGNYLTVRSSTTQPKKYCSSKIRLLKELGLEVVYGILNHTYPREKITSTQLNQIQI